MGATASVVNIVDEYFRTWEESDFSSLVVLFSPDATYEILPIGKTLKGHAEISEYWKRNKNRQKSLSLWWKTISFSSKHIEVIFIAEFDDCEELERQKIVGEIFFSIVGNATIKSLTETYRKYICGS